MFHIDGLTLIPRILEKLVLIVVSNSNLLFLFNFKITQNLSKISQFIAYSVYITTF